MTLRRVMLAIVTYSAFCLVTLFDPDFLLTEGKIKIPFVESPIRAIDFFYFGPVVLIAIALYMHIFVGYWQEEIRIKQSRPKERAGGVSAG